MITVTFPTGVRVTYNDANTVQWYSDRVEILCKTDSGKLFYRAAAPLQTGCLIEWTKPCAVLGPPVASPDSLIDVMCSLADSGELHRAASWKVKGLKRALRKFNGRSGVWR
jgi:hypothetical protein